jgi:hypothetical protein
MSRITETAISAASYNSLPLIEEMAKIPETDRKNLDDLRSLLRKHNVPDVVCVRLIHKHFDALDSEIMVLRTIPAPPHGVIQIMGPAKTQTLDGLRGLNYRVNDSGQFEPYEYTTSAGTDLSSHASFLEEFAQIVKERGLQNTWGLKIGLEEDKGGWTEFEYPDKRSTMCVPQGISLPPVEFSFTVTTDWYGGGKPVSRCWHCGHCGHCDHCGHCGHGGWWALQEEGSKDNVLYFGETRLGSENPDHGFIKTAIMAM